MYRLLGCSVVQKLQKQPFLGSMAHHSHQTVRTIWAKYMLSGMRFGENVHLLLQSTSLMLSKDKSEPAWYYRHTQVNAHFAT